MQTGVGGWAQYGIDPRLFPERLMEEVHKVLQEGRQSDVVDIICTAFENSKQITGMREGGVAYISLFLL